MDRFLKKALSEAGDFREAPVFQKSRSRKSDAGARMVLVPRTWTQYQQEGHAQYGDLKPEGSRHTIHGDHQLRSAGSRKDQVKLALDRLR